MNINELFTAKGFETFLTEYHKRLHEAEGFPHLTGNKPMHVAGKLFNLKGAEPFRNALAKHESDVGVGRSLHPVNLIVRKSGKQKFVPFSTTQNAMNYAHMMCLSYMIQNDIELGELLNEHLSEHAEGIKCSDNYCNADNTEERVLAALAYLPDSKMLDLLTTISRGGLIIKFQ